jgi:hypothetical protein
MTGATAQSSFTEEMTGVKMDTLTIGGNKVGVPKEGTSALTATDGTYTGTFTFTKEGSDYKHTGTISYNGAVVANVYLTFNQTVGNYTGYYINAGETTHNDIS